MRTAAALTSGTAATLAGIGALHAAWGLGSTFPFATAEELTDTVVGAPVVPSPAACFAVAGALGAAAALVAGVPGVPRFIRRSGLATVGTVLATRGVLGLTGHTDVVVPGSDGVRFRRLDRRYYSPLCLVLSAGAATALASA